MPKRDESELSQFERLSDKANGPPIVTVWIETGIRAANTTSVQLKAFFRSAGGASATIVLKKVMRALWKGAISFGLVTIPVSLYPATRREELKFRLLRKSDQSPVNYKRVAEADGKEVPWDQIVKGYEYEKGKFVIIKDEDFARVDVEATQTVNIINFVSVEEVDPLLFYKPYYLEAGKGGDKAYVLLRDALVDSGKIAIALVVIRTREHLAAVKPQQKGLMLD
jgi:DNA end-binding protein Ku